MAQRKAKYTYDALAYDLFLWVFSIVLDLFFRQVHARSTWRIPRTGSIIFVAAPHANQFVDPLIVMHTVRHEAGRRLAILTAAKSMKRQFIGAMARITGAVPVGRALDSVGTVPGTIYLPDPEGNPTLIRGHGTDFTSKKFMKRGLLVLPSVENSAANAEIEEVLGPEELRLRGPFKGENAKRQLTKRAGAGGTGHESEGTEFKVAPHIDQSAVYDAVFERIAQEDCVLVFPESGSHDRTDLLPLKPGVAIMALGARAQGHDVKLVCVGLNYFHAHKFRSRAVIEFGSPIEVSDELLDEYKSGNRREATGKLLEHVYDGLSAVTTQAPDYDTLMLIQAVRRLYNPKGKRLPLSQVVELNRRLMKGYTTYKNDPRVVSLRKAVLNYNRQLFRINVRDHQLSYARFPWYKVVATLIYRVLKLAVLSIAVLPGTVLFAPVFIAGKLISIRKSREALAASTVKIKARDVVATWKILVSLALAPTLDVFYTCLFSYWNYRSHCNGYMPEWMPTSLVAIFGLFFFPSLCFLALRFGEIGMDIAKSLRPLMLSLNPTSGNTLVKLRKRRAQLQEQVNALINELGPELFPDFDFTRIISDPGHATQSPEHSRPSTPRRRERSGSVEQISPITQPPPLQRRTTNLDSLPRNESFGNLGNIGILSTRPSTPNHSRSRTNSGSHDFGDSGRKLQGFTALHESQPIKSKAELDEVSRNLHAAMRERGRRRETLESDQWEEGDRSGARTPSSDGDVVELRKDV